MLLNLSGIILRKSIYNVLGIQADSKDRVKQLFDRMEEIGNDRFVIDTDGAFWYLSLPEYNLRRLFGRETIDKQVSKALKDVGIRFHVMDGLVEYCKRLGCNFPHKDIEEIAKESFIRYVNAHPYAYQSGLFQMSLVDSIPVLEGSELSKIAPAVRKEMENGECFSRLKDRAKRMRLSGDKRSLTDDDIRELRHSDGYQYYDAMGKWKWPEVECEGKDDHEER